MGPHHSLSCWFVQNNIGDHGKNLKSSEIVEKSLTLWVEKGSGIF